MMSSMMSRLLGKTLSGAPLRSRRWPALALVAGLTISAPAQCQDGNEWDAAHARLLASAPDTISGAIAQWRVLDTARSDYGQDFSSVAGFLMAWPGFPDADKLQLAAEKGLARAPVDAGRLVAFFDRYPPLTNPARARYALALASVGRPEAVDVARAAWRSGTMADADAAAIRARFGARFTTDDNDTRLDALLWDDNIAGAANALPYASPTARGIGAARLALQRGVDPESDASAWQHAPSRATAPIPPDPASRPAPERNGYGGGDNGDTGDNADEMPPPPEPSPQPYQTQPYQYQPVAQPGRAVLDADPGYLLDRTRYLLRRDRADEAARLLGSHPGFSHPALVPRKWVAVLLAAARRAGPDGTARIAGMVRDGFAPGVEISGQGFAIRDDATSLYWLAGTGALWQLGDGNRAARLFIGYARAALTPQTRAKGYYWAGRALAQSGGQLGNGEDAASEFAFAAQYPDQFYGILALERLGQPLPPLGDPPHPEPDARTRAEFAARPITRAVREVARDADWYTTIRFFREIAAQSQGEIDDVLVADLARNLGRRDLGVILGQAAANGGEPGFRSVSFPMVVVPPGANWTWVHAISRQESQFSTNALSSAGARGLMQMMPATGAEVARKLGLEYSRASLEDAGFNMRVGDSYFAHLLSVFGGSYPLAVAAYNAGPGNVGKWLRANGDPREGAVDWVTWIERIPLTETRTYVQHVMENAVVYEALYPRHAAYHGPDPLSYYLGKRRPG